MTFYRRFFTDFLNANRYVFPAHSLPLNFSFILFDFPHASHHSPPPLEPHITNCANIGFSVGYPVAAAAAVGAAALQGPAGGSTLNVSRNINKY